ncbi:MAG: hypothetical protein GY754_23305 [bacterium]|nr:hypothetical protein [bacterium]
MSIQLKQEKSIILVIIISMLIMFSGCISTPVGISTSTTPLHNKTIVKNLGKAEGSDGSLDILMIISVSRPDIDAAIKEAVDSKGGDALINVRVYQEVSYFLLLSYTKVVVTGEVVKFGE